MLRLRAAAPRNFLSVIDDIKEGADIPTSSRGSWAPLRPLSRSLPEAFSRQMSGWDGGGRGTGSELPPPGT